MIWLLSLKALNKILDARDKANETIVTFGSASAVADVKKRKFEIFNKLAQSTDRPIRPERVIDAMMKVLPPDATIVSDPGTSCPYISAYYELQTPGRYFITNRAHGALGYSLSAALGAWYGRPSSKVVALMGDGSFGFTCGELETVCRSKALNHLYRFFQLNFWLD